MKEIETELLKLRDEQYAEFHAKLIPGVSRDKVIGIRVPVLRSKAKELYNKDPKTAELFLKELPHTYYEENNLHGLIIEQIKDFDKALKLTEEFLPYVDNWATCDMFSPKVFKKNKEELYKRACVLLKSGETYTVRYAIKILMDNFLDEDFSTEVLEAVSNVKSEEYYVNMMIAWFFATALAKQYDSAVKYIEANRLSVWTHNKTISKARDSFRICGETKEYLKTLKRH